jgi:hypothetical protein
MPAEGPERICGSRAIASRPYPWRLVRLVAQPFMGLLRMVAQPPLTAWKIQTSEPSGTEVVSPPVKRMFSSSTKMLTCSRI